jgi:hypothetical protein
VKKAAAPKPKKPVPPVKAKAPPKPVKAKAPPKPGKKPEKKTVKRKTVKRVHLSPKQQRVKDRAEAKTELRDAAQDRRGAARATAAARTAYLNQDAAAAVRDLARAGRDRASAARDVARAKRDLTASRTKTGRLPRHEAARKKHEAARHEHRKVTHHRIKAKEKRPGLAGRPPSMSSEPWISGRNDQHSGCAAVAVANSLLLATGHRVSDAAVTDLYYRATGGPDRGATISEVLAVVQASGLDGYSLSSIQKLDRRVRPAAGALLELRLRTAQAAQIVWDWRPSPRWGEHAVLLLGGSVAAWGAETPVSGAFLRRQVTTAWQVAWKRQSPRSVPAQRVLLRDDAVPLLP